ncbi:MAG: hypothetical protein JJU41_04950 [Bacteroidetes bacterium]|nr:hypothetical protein [Bacteroidota bacterium]MCH8525264.1 hypothetical protein [Balneolales bacterium]
MASIRLVPLTKMVAPGSGSPVLASVTTPKTVPRTGSIAGFFDSTVENVAPRNRTDKTKIPLTLANR